MKKIRFWKQHSMETCAISCMMMAMDAFGVDFPTRAKEEKLYRMYGSKAAPGTQCAAIAYALARRGLDVRLVHGSERMFENRDGYYPPEMYEALYAEYVNWIARGAGLFDVQTGAVDCGMIRGELERGRIVITAIVAEGDADGMHDHVMHGVLIYGMEGDLFCVCDPLCGRITMTRAELENQLDTPEGRCCLSVGEKN